MHLEHIAIVLSRYVLLVRPHSLPTLLPHLPTSVTVTLTVRGIGVNGWRRNLCKKARASVGSGLSLRDAVGDSMLEENRDPVKETSAGRLPKYTLKRSTTLHLRRNSTIERSESPRLFSAIYGDSSAMRIPPADLRAFGRRESMRQ